MSSPALLAALLAAVSFEPYLPAEQKAAVQDALTKAVSTPTGAARARRLIDGGWTVRVGTAAFGLRSVDDLGTPRLVGKAGNTDATESPTLVTFDPVLFSRAGAAMLPGTAAHEILGHAVNILEARKTGVYSPWMSSAEDEMLATLVGLEIQRELGGPAPAGTSKILVESTQAFAEQMWFGWDGNPTCVSIDEISAPSEALAGRSAAYDQEQARLEKVIDDCQIWMTDIGHFQFIHGEPESRRQKLWSYCVDAQNESRDSLANLRAAREEVRGNFFWLSGPEGIARRKALGSRRYRRFVEKAAQEISELRAKLAAPESAQPAAAGEPETSEWDELRDLVEKDKRLHPDHWR
jgi:hypothetical protein